MYSKDQVSQLKQEFWTAFGQYIAPQLSAEGLRINWINYKTGIKHLFFKMQADKRQATIGIEITHPDAGMQELVFEQFKEFKKLFEAQVQEEWEWELGAVDEYGKKISRIYTVLPGVSIFKKEDWPALISFFKPRMIALDEFWNDAQHSFDVFK
ncbi:DUF4268 domain-containing protein [Pedobacter hiemivivus]|uniref:DUF4268 domain-containing protein n=1 Tax=Pedobacter hiemivivus TaxID=2530454 RepID=A0A4R0NDB2_9SPHI|nr:DUF4268 domain-containing protein [Pedobacter hiemivivus]TCC98359.1 DUF4268 domain-containing protein [Pedobacter hiemivivus]